MAKRKRRYTEEFKREAVRLYESSGKTQVQIEAELGIGAGRLSRWNQQYGTGEGRNHEEREELVATAKRVRQLERENEILRQERDILKKAVAIFSRPSKRASNS